MIRRLWARLFARCQHDFVNTGASYTDAQYGFTVVLRQCKHCHQTLMVEV